MNANQAISEPSLKWHRVPAAERRTFQVCPVCDLPRAAFGRYSGRTHRATRPEETPGTRWEIIARFDSHQLIGPDGSPVQQPGNAHILTPARKQMLTRAAELLTCKLKRKAVAAQLGISPPTLQKYIERHREHFDAELARMKDSQPSLVQSQKPRKEKISPELKKAMLPVAAAIAAGKSNEEATLECGCTPETLRHWEREYSKLWQSELDRAFEASCRVIRAMAGSAAILDDPAAYLAQARTCQRWTKKNGRPLFAPKDEMTLSSFLETWFIRVRLFDASPETIKTYRQHVATWVLLTGDPPLNAVDPVTLAFFRDAMMKLRGQKPARRRAANSVRSVLRHIQVLLDKAGPSGRRNRDAAGILPNPPWVKAPREEFQPVRIVPDKCLEWCYLSATAMNEPRLPGVRAAAWWRALLVVARCTGLRRRTLLQLRWEHVDWENSRFQIPGAFFKNHKPQTIPLPPVAIQHLHSIRTDRERIFEWPYRFWTSFHVRFHQLQTAAGIPPADHFGLHDIRRTVTTLMWADSPEAAQLLCGHASADTTIRSYISADTIVAKAVAMLPVPKAFFGEQEAATPPAAPSDQRPIMEFWNGLSTTQAP